MKVRFEEFVSDCCVTFCYLISVSLIKKIVNAGT